MLISISYLDRGQSASHHGRRQRRGEDEARAIGANHVDEHDRAGNVAANHAEGLAQRARDDVNLVPGRSACKNRDQVPRTYDKYT